MQDNNSSEVREIEENDSNGVKSWFEDNLRVLLSILIVVAIAGGIYSYSQRSASPGLTQVDNETITGTTDTPEEASPSTEADKMIGETNQAQPGDTQRVTAPRPGSQVSSAETSKETETSFVETAVAGNGVTHLARGALANYLEKNADSSLTLEHKIYIEDYLRKHVGFKDSVHVGTSVEFSKDLIKQAIEQSKTLNDKQLQNLKQYSKRAPSLR